MSATTAARGIPPPRYDADGRVQRVVDLAIKLLRYGLGACRDGDTLVDLALLGLAQIPGPRSSDPGREPRAYQILMQTLDSSV